MSLVMVHIIFGLLIARILISPLQRLSEKSRNFAKGKLNIRVSEERNDEIGDLSKAFNFMASSIESKINELNEEIKLRKKNEEIVRKQNIDLEKLNEMKDEFVAIVSHDIRSPFSNIIGILALLINDEKITLTDEYKHILKSVILSSDDILKMINKLLDLTSFEKGKIKITQKVANLYDITMKSYNKMIYSFKTKGIQFILDIDKDCTVYVDEIWIMEVLINLLNNSLKFTKQDGFVKVFTTPIENSTMIWVTVEDNGIGISAKILQNLFNKHIKTSTRGLQGEKGTGIGLPLCHAIIELHKGKFWVDSKEGEYTKMNFSLPTVK